MTSIAITGNYRASCAVIALPVAQAAALLDTNCELGVQPLSPPGTHPIIVLLGRQWNVRVGRLPITAKYLETVVSVPWVRLRGRPDLGPFAHVSRLWLNKVLPVIGGWFWGFPKMWESIAITADRYVVRTLIRKRPLVDAQLQLQGKPALPSQFPNFAAVRPIFEQTFLQRFLIFGPTCCCTLDFELDQGTVQPLRATIDMTREALPAIGALRVSVESIETTSLGGFVLELPWTLTYPFRPGGNR